ncbi:hypothetical protein K8P10_001980 [Leucobacter sp. Psy1]|uniref:phage portal protein n=1 Tax=Leucobacter sp. Psy1 TaxID=2875729 RepID=UPI001CD62A32|nr:phage portal protein [Leucobacter sp. Psy1]UBH06469.1 hypothetical protein K8P10_001980 [Leucobacter sp. Psy1]
MGRVSNAFRALVTPSEKRSRRRMPSLGGSRTLAGVTVTPELALQVNAVYSAVRLVSEAIACLPVSVVKKQGRSRRAPSGAHARTARLITIAPNPTMDAGEFWRLLTAWMLLRGNAYAYVQRDGNGDVQALWPIPPTMVKVLRTPTGVLAYKLSHDQRDCWLPVEPGYVATHLEVLHYRWFGLGTEGLSPIGVARQTIGISHAATAYVGGFFERDATPETVVTTQGNLTEEQYDRLLDQLEDRHQGFDKSHNLAVFEGGAKLERVSLSPADAAFLDIYKLTRSDIASIYGVPPHKIGDLEHATFSNIEHQSIEFVQDGLLPPIRRLELVTASLFADDDMQIKFDTKGRMRGDTATQAQSYATGRQWGYLSANDIRALEDKDPIEGGDVYLEPINMIPAGQTTVQRAGNSPAQIPTLAPTEYRAAIERRAAPAEESPTWSARITTVLVGYLDEFRDEVAAALAAERNLRSLAQIDGDVWEELLAEQLQPVFAGIVSEFGERAASQVGGTFASGKTTNWVLAAARRQAHSYNVSLFESLERVLSDLGETSVLDALRTFFEGRAAETALVAATVVNAIGGFGRHEGAAQNGARMKTWVVNSSNPRPSHAAMARETVSIDEPFSNGCMWPCDPSGGVDEVAGCTCSVMFEYEEDLT